MIISGKELSAKMKAAMAEQVASFPAKYGRVPHLAVILVGVSFRFLQTTPGNLFVAKRIVMMSAAFFFSADRYQPVTFLGMGMGRDFFLSADVFCFAAFL